MEKLIGLIVATILAGAGSVAGYEMIIATGQAATAETSARALVKQAALQYQSGILTGEIPSVDQALQTARDSMDSFPEDTVIQDGRVTVRVGDACYQATVTVLDSPADYREC